MVSLTPALVTVSALVLGATTLSPIGFPGALPSEAPAPPPRTLSAPSRLASADHPSADLSSTDLPASGAGTSWAGGTSSTTLRDGWHWPLHPEPVVTRRFSAPASRWGPGHRGIDLAAASGQPVLAAAAGRVTHVGVVAGRGTVSVLHVGGVRTTYEPVRARVRRGDAVRESQVIGVVDERGGSHCSSCLHLGALRGRAYLDPLALLRPGRVVLLPLAGR